MEKVNYLPIGSVVLLKGGCKKLLIISRALQVRTEDSEYYFDYGGVVYPEGLFGEQIAYFNSEGIREVVFKGYSDTEEEKAVKNLNNYLEKKNIKKGDLFDFNEKGGRLWDTK